MRVALYLRVSSEDQVKGASLTVQRARLEELAAREGWEAQVFSDDGVSSSIAPWDRPGFATALAWGPEAVAVQDFDRIVRSELHWFQLRQDHPELHIISLDGVDTRRGEELALVDGFRALVSADEKRRIRNRTVRGREQRAREGKWPSGPAPYGLQVVPAPDGRGKVLALHEYEAKVIRRAMELVLDHGLANTSHLAAALNAEGLERAPGKRWIYFSLRRILNAEHLYQGFVPWGREGLPIPAPVIVEEDRWRQVQAALASTAKLRGNATRVYPLSGRLLHTEADERGAPLHYIGWRNGSGVYLYRCNAASKQKYVKAEEIEARVWKAVTDLLLDKERLLALLPEPAPEDGSLGDQVETLRRKVKELESATARLEVNLAKGTISDTAAALARQELADEYAQAQEHLGRVEAWQARSEEAQARRDEIISLTKLNEALANADLALQRHVYEVLDLHAAVSQQTAGSWAAARLAQMSGRILGAAGVEAMDEFLGGDPLTVFGEVGADGIVADGLIVQIAGELTPGAALRIAAPAHRGLEGYSSPV